MTSLHRSIPAWAPDPGGSNALVPFSLRMHFTTARPLEVRLRVPLRIVDEDWTPPAACSRQAWVGWCVDREMLKASAWVSGSTFGIGNVRVGQTSRHWMANLRRSGRAITVGTQVGWVREYANLVDGIAPPNRMADLLDIDGMIARLLGAGA